MASLYVQFVVGDWRKLSLFDFSGVRESCLGFFIGTKEEQSDSSKLFVICAIGGGHRKRRRSSGVRREDENLSTFLSDTKPWAD